MDKKQKEKGNKKIERERNWRRDGEINWEGESIQRRGRKSERKMQKVWKSSGNKTDDEKFQQDER